MTSFYYNLFGRVSQFNFGTLQQFFARRHGKRLAAQMLYNARERAETERHGTQKLPFCARRAVFGAVAVFIVAHDGNARMRRLRAQLVRSTRYGVQPQQRLLPFCGHFVTRDDLPTAFLRRVGNRAIGRSGILGKVSPPLAARLRRTAEHARRIRFVHLSRRKRRDQRVARRRGFGQDQ